MARHLALALLPSLAAFTLAGCRGTGAAPQRPTVRVAAAADLTAAFEEVGRQFEAETKQEVVFSFGASGQLARQLAQGAPFDAFAAASTSFVDQVVAARVCDGATRGAYARGRVVAWSREEGPSTLSALAEARWARIAIANPEHAPYGMAAKQALVAAGVWDGVRAKLVYGENVRQALQFAQTGNAEVALVALSLVVQGGEGRFLLVDEALHEPLDQAMVACRGGARFEGGKEFVAFVGSAAGRATMRRYGFLLPGEAAGAP